MSMYSTMFGQNTRLAYVASAILDANLTDFPRFRDVFTVAEDSPYEGDFFLYSRMGGGNAECWGGCSDEAPCSACVMRETIAEYEKAGIYVGSYDDAFDSTYRTVVLKVPESSPTYAEWTKLKSGDVGPDFDMPATKANFERLFSRVSNEDEKQKQTEGA